MSHFREKIKITCQFVQISVRMVAKGFTRLKTVIRNYRASKKGRFQLNLIVILNIWSENNSCNGVFSKFCSPRISASNRNLETVLKSPILTKIREKRYYCFFVFTVQKACVVIEPTSNVWIFLN